MWDDECVDELAWIRDGTQLKPLYQLFKVLVVGCGDLLVLWHLTQASYVSSLLLKPTTCQSGLSASFFCLSLPSASGASFRFCPGSLGFGNQHEVNSKFYVYILPFLVIESNPFSSWRWIWDCYLAQVLKRPQRLLRIDCLGSWADTGQPIRGPWARWVWQIMVAGPGWEPWGSQRRS